MSQADVLRKVRALLAKAEASTFPEEAEAFAAKAEELIARHAIELHLVHAKEGTREAPEMRMIKLENPYTRPKAVLLNQIAQRYRVVAVMFHWKNSAFPHEVQLAGFPSDLDAVEMLWTSLMLQQAHAAARLEVSGNPAQRMSQRTSFLYGYSNRVAARLDEIKARTEGPAATGSALVLRDRLQEVNEFAADLLGGSKNVKTKPKNAASFWAGDEAAKTADLNQDRLGRTRTEIDA